MRILVTGATGYLGSRLVTALLANGHGLRDRVPDPPGGLLGVEDAITLSPARRSNGRPKPVNALTDPHQLADSDPAWAGGDALRIRRLARAITPPIARPSPA
jgi:nucleoside-diphosphate-sugar epimerase